MNKGPRKQDRAQGKGRRKSAVDRPEVTPPHRRPAPPIDETPDFEPLVIASHGKLRSAQEQAEIFRRFEQNPGLAMMFVMNPVLALKDVGVQLQPAVADHLLRAFQHPDKLRIRRNQLEESLHRELGETAKTEDPKWVAKVLFERLELAPLDTEGAVPSYVDVLGRAGERVQRNRRPIRRKWDNEATGRPPHGMRLKLSMPRSTRRRLDLSAPLPDLKRAAKVPAEVELEQLYFYRDAHPIARDLLELAVLRARAFPIQTGDGYRRIKEGAKSSPLRSWITSIRFRVKEPPA